MEGAPETRPAAPALLAQLGQLAQGAICTRATVSAVHPVRIGDEAHVAIRFQVDAHHAFLPYLSAAEAAELAVALVTALPMEQRPQVITAITVACVDAVGDSIHRALEAAVLERGGE